MLVGMVHGADCHSKGNLTALPACLEILSIFIINIDSCNFEDCRKYHLCKVVMRNLQAILERRNEFTPRLTNFEALFVPGYGPGHYLDYHSMSLLRAEIKGMIVPLGEAVGVKVLVSYELTLKHYQNVEHD